jgi:hypothetical protein
MDALKVVERYKADKTSVPVPEMNAAIRYLTAEAPFYQLIDKNMVPTESDVYTKDVATRMQQRAALEVKAEGLGVEPADVAYRREAAEAQLRRAGPIPRERATDVTPSLRQLQAAKFSAETKRAAARESFQKGNETAIRRREQVTKLLEKVRERIRQRTETQIASQGE